MKKNKDQNQNNENDQEPVRKQYLKARSREKSGDNGHEHFQRREENLRDNKIVNDEDPNLGRGKYQSKQGEGKSSEPSTKGGETE